MTEQHRVGDDKMPYVRMLGRSLTDIDRLALWIARVTLKAERGHPLACNWKACDRWLVQPGLTLVTNPGLLYTMGRKALKVSERTAQLTARMSELYPKTVQELPDYLEFFVLPEWKPRRPIPAENKKKEGAPASKLDEQIERDMEEQLEPSSCPVVAVAPIPPAAAGARAAAAQEPMQMQVRSRDMRAAHRQVQSSALQVGVVTVSPIPPVPVKPPAGTALNPAGDAIMSSGAVTSVALNANADEGDVITDITGSNTDDLEDELDMEAFDPADDPMDT